eukprot:6298826-Lingulodinium_polyedra.AAC.1
MARWPCSPDGPIVRLGSDCSGMDSPEVALDQLSLGARVEVPFASDMQEACRRLCTVGPLCQPWPAAGEA